MTTIEIPRSYDFDKVFGPLPVLFQDGQPTCVPHTRATITNAMERVYNDRETHYDGHGRRAIRWTQDGACDYVIEQVDSGRDLGRVTNGSCDPSWTREQTPDMMRRILLGNAIAELGVPSRVRSFARAYKTRVNRHWRVPVIGVDIGPETIDHDIAAVGYRPRGLLILNPWGTDWGKNGRAILTWEFVAHFGLRLLPYGYNGHPLGGLDIAAKMAAK